MNDTSRCAYWIGSDAAGHRCEEAAERAGHCAKHYPIALRKLQQQQERLAASAARRDAAWRARNLSRLPQWRVQLERVEAEYARRTASAVQDRAAVGGDMHVSIVRAQSRHLSDANVARVVELERLAKRLRADIARAEGSAS
ncbi:hypothetical protein [Microbacterium sp. 1P06AB]|uniref:hypothetical protein n=1 Tax=Microbacterium sp. 1P06AB TaxID=3132289 RepID=UPI0039A746E6